VADVEAVERAGFRRDRLLAVLEPLGASVLYVAACDLGPGTARAPAFFHAGEDPATGSAAGALCAYLDARTGLAAVAIEQGVEMGRPGRIAAQVEADRVRVGGDAVVVVDGTLRL